MGQAAQCPDDVATRVFGLPHDSRADSEPSLMHSTPEVANGHRQATEGKSRASTDPGLAPKKEEEDEEEGQTQLGRCVAFSAARIYRLEANGLPEQRVELDVENGLPGWDGDDMLRCESPGSLLRCESPGSFESDRGFEAAVTQRERPGAAEPGYDTVSTTAKSEDGESSTTCKIGRQETDARRRSSYGRDPRKKSVKNVDTGLVVGADETNRMSLTYNKSSRGSQAQGKPFPKRPMMSRLSRSTWTRLEDLFRKMDIDGSNAITRGKANSFFEGAFGKISCDAMFNEVDVDGSGVVTTEEFLRFWLQVRSSGYSDAQILEEVEELLEGGAWVDWKDNRDTTNAEVKFPKRPLFSKLSQKAWNKCEELFKMMDKECTMVITQNNALCFYKGSFAKVSCDAMFNEIDENQHGVITAAEWMKFWTQVKGAGYKESNIIEEIELIMDGGTWVDWKDNRTPC